MLLQQLVSSRELTNGYRWSLIIGLIVVVVLSVAAYIFSPKGENLTLVTSLKLIPFITYVADRDSTESGAVHSSSLSLHVT